MNTAVKKRVLIFGATSAIATAVARELLDSQTYFCLLARNSAALDTLREDLLARGAVDVSCITFDAQDLSGHKAAVNQISSLQQSFDIVLLAYGVLPTQLEVESHPETLTDGLIANYLSPSLLLLFLAPELERWGRGVVAVISSVAGDRGRRSNYIYGSAKAGLSVFLEGFRQRMHAHGVKVLTIKPGFVDTPMTAHLKKGPLFSSAEDVAAQIEKAISSRKSEIYVPKFWRWIMWIIRIIPEWLLRRLPI